MLKRLLIPLLLIVSLKAICQTTTTDSSALNDLREYPQKNILPVRRPVLQLQPVEVPESKLNLKVNYWRNWVTFGINMNQAAFSNNWSGGGVNSVAIGTNFNYKADYTKGDKNFVSEVILQYGKIKNKDQLQRKSNDRIYWDNKVGLKLAQSWNFFGSVNFQSQFDTGFSYSKDADGNEIATPISKFMSPGYLTESLGIEFVPNKIFSLRIGTGTARQTFVLDKELYKKTNNVKNYGVDTGKVFRNELAFQLVANYSKTIMENITLTGKYSMFANYEELGSIDQRLDITLVAKVNKLVNVTFTGVGLYDDDASDKIQASQTLALGLVYKFPQ